MINLSFFLLTFSAHSKILFHSDFERGETYLAKAIKPGAKSIELVPNFRLEEWPVDGGEGIIQGNLPSQAERFRYSKRLGNLLEGVSGLTKAHVKWAAIGTGGFDDWQPLQSEKGETRNSSISVSKSKALFGSHSLQIKCHDRSEAALGSKLRRSPSRMHVRFYFSFSELDIFGEGYPELPVCYVGFGIFVTPRISLLRAKDEASISLGFSRVVAGPWRVLKKDNPNRELPGLKPDNRYCVEFGVVKTNDSQGELRLWVDGKLCELLVVEFEPIKSEVAGNFVSMGKLSKQPFATTLWFDEVVFGETYIGPVLDGPNVEFRDSWLCGTPKNGSVPEDSLLAWQWQISSSNSWVMPVYNSGERGAEFGEMRVPFQTLLEGDLGTDMEFPDTFFVPTEIKPLASYLARSRWKHVSGRWSEWSSPLAFKAPGREPDSAVPPSVQARVRRAYFTHRGSEIPLAQIKKGDWYDFHFRFSENLELGLNKDAFLDLYMNSDPENEVSNYRNRGGAFSPQNQYMVSFDFRPREIFAREMPGIMHYTRYQSGKGLYCDISENILKFDLAKGHIRFRMRLLDSAVTGLWSARGFLRVRDGLATPFFQTVFNVIDVPSNSSSGIAFWVAACLFGAAGIAAILWLRGASRRRASPLPDEGSIPVLSGTQRTRIEAAKTYMQQNFSKPILPRDVATAIGLTPNWLSTVFRDGTGQTVGEYLLNLRIAEAKRLLLETNATISEISIKAGFGSFRAFRKSFLNATGLSAARFRKQAISR